MGKRIFCLLLAVGLAVCLLPVTGLAAEGDSVHLIHTPKLVGAKEPTDTEAGYTGDLTCSECGETLVSGMQIPPVRNLDSLIPELPEHLIHSPGLVNAKEPTDAQSGYTGDIVCAECGEVLVTGLTIDPTGSAEHRIHSPELVNTVDPTYLDPGYTGDVVCSECGELLLSGVDIAPTGADSYLLDNPFEDVKPLAYYYKSVLWAYYGGITTGKTEDTFAPRDDCTRAQIVTFLWRTLGEPEPRAAESPFTDIDENAYYYKAVLWAVENGITKGTSDTTFTPGRACTRGEVVTFLWRAMGEPDAETASTAFPDVASGKYDSDAVQWAVEEEITEGYTDGTFRPKRVCSRAEVVTFLYRCFTE